MKAATLAIDKETLGRRAEARLRSYTSSERAKINFDSLGMMRRAQRLHCAADPWEAAKKIALAKQRTFTEGILGRDYSTIIWFGSARAGKSFGTCLGFLSWGYRCPGAKFIVGRYEAKNLFSSTMVSMGEALGHIFRRPDWGHIEHITPDVGRWRPSLGVLELHDGGEYHFRHFKDASGHGSTEYDGGWIEEGQEIPGEEREAGAGEERSRTPEVVTMVQSRLNRITQPRNGGEPPIPKLVITAMGWGRNWAWEMAYGRE